MSYIVRYGGGGKGGGGETHIDYHWLFSIAELKTIQDATISFKATLGNIVFIGDGIKNSFYIPNVWERLYYFQGGYGIETFYPQNIKLYLNSINNLLIENTDYTYNSDTGLVTLNFTPEKNDLIAMTVTYDPENPRETTFYASFAFAELFKRIGFKYYKVNEDYYNTLTKISRASKGILNNIWIPMMSGKMDIVYNPLVSLGQTIYVKDPKTGFDNIVFIKGFDKTLGNSPSLTLDILNYPSMVEINNFGQSSSGIRFNPNLPTLGVSFIDETDDDSDYYGDGLFFRAEILDYFGSKYNIFKNPVKISLVLNNKVRIFPSSENDINNYYLKNTRGILSQYYTASFRKSANGEYVDDSDLQNDFPEFFDTGDPKLFINKTVQLILEDLKSGAKTTQAIYVTFGSKRPFKGYFVPSYPYDPFITFGGNREYIYVVDKSKRLWKVNNLLESSYIDTLDFLNENSFCIISSGKNIFIVDNGAENVKKYDVESKTYNTYTINGCLCGCNVYLNHKHIYDENNNPLFYFRGYSNTTDVPYVSYVNFIKYKEFEDTMVKTKWKFTISDKVFAGIPFVYKNVLYFGKIGFNLKNSCSYEGEHNWTSESSCPLIVDNSNLVFKDDFSLNKIKTIYISDLLENSLWVVGSDCSSADDYHLTQPRVIGKEVIIGKRKDNTYDDPFDPSKDSTHWVKIAKFTSSTNDIENWDIMPLALYGNKLLILVKGKEPERIIKNFNFGLAVFDESDKKIHFKIIKYYGDNIKGTQLEQQLIHSIWFRDKILYNWKDYSYILNLDDIYTISGE